MPVTLNGQNYFRTSEVCARVGISRSTLLRWIREGSSADAECRDRRGWRLFSEADLARLAAETRRVYTGNNPDTVAGAWECSYCAVGFTDQRALKQHLLEEHYSEMLKVAGRHEQIPNWAAGYLSAFGCKKGRR